MTTDITELAQSLNICAKEGTYPVLSPADCGALVEALEKAQGMEAYWKTQCRGITDHCEELQTRIAGLESRTVTVTAAAADVLAERKRQVSVEGWTPSHDDAHKNNEMAFAAACYAFHAAAASWDLEDCGTDYDSHPAPKNWPWEPEWWKPKSARADLVRAGALILAELERIDRAAGIKREAE
ncbi:hypothetical protein [Raoultella ornithinolytica]|uniref:hypothetical protein n=1 Tax=Raoultella ornithinolytica TaxID=54291 RepID=UPI002DB990BF|nr:hypothetical protein [Raoultella ornithinolytica]MEB7957314.1 hypothetical protein [Raoultella ornithinolytica]